MVRKVSCNCVQQAALAETVPSSTSEWPAGYFVAAWIETSTPKSSALK
jgi:hypothetical protein